MAKMALPTYRQKLIAQLLHILGLRLSMLEVSPYILCSALALETKIRNCHLRKFNHCAIRLRGLRYLFIDEKSMIGASMLYRIHKRLAVAFPSVEDSPFGGISIILMD